MAKGGSGGKSSKVVGGAGNSGENQNNESIGGAAQSNGIKQGVPNSSTEYYVSGNGMWINQDLRKGNTDYWSDSDREYLKEMDAATNGEINDNILFRNVDASAVFGEQINHNGVAGSKADNLIEVMNYGAPSGSYGQQMKHEAESLKNSVIGKTITDKGFMSTTATEEVASEWGNFTGSSHPMVLRFTNAKGIKGVDVSGYDKNAYGPAQNERLLARNTSYKIKKVYSKNGVLYADAEFIKD